MTLKRFFKAFNYIIFSVNAISKMNSKLKESNKKGISFFETGFFFEILNNMFFFLIF